MTYSCRRSSIGTAVPRCTSGSAAEGTTRSGTEGGGGVAACIGQVAARIGRVC